MIQMRTILDVADNSGARKIAAINPIVRITTIHECVSQSGTASR